MTAFHSLVLKTDSGLTMLMYGAEAEVWAQMPLGCNFRMRTLGRVTETERSVGAQWMVA